MYVIFVFMYVCKYVCIYIYLHMYICMYVTVRIAGSRIGARHVVADFGARMFDSPSPRGGCPDLIPDQGGPWTQSRACTLR